MGAVAAEAEVSRSTAYLHARSPRDLLEDALRAELDLFRERRLRDIPARRLAAARDAAARDTILHVERHLDVYRVGMAERDGLHGVLREHFAESVRMLLEHPDLAPDDPEVAVDEVVRALVVRSIADATTAQIEVWVAQPPPRDIEVFLAVNRALMPSWWPESVGVRAE